MGVPGNSLTERTPAADRLTVAAFAVWALAPIAALLAAARNQHGVWGGAWAALTPADQYRYLAWIRDAGDNLLISNAFGLDPGGHVYLHPMFLLSGLAWKVGVPLQLAYVLWLPACVAVLVWGWRSYVVRTVCGEWARCAALLLALFFFTPLLPLVDYGGAFNADQNWYAVISAGAVAPYWQAWGYLPALAAVGLMPVYLLGIEAVADPPRRGDGAAPRWSVAWPAGAGLVAAWLHPWAGLTLLLVTAGLVAWDRFARRNLALLIPVLATAAPLVYHWLLARSNPAWGLGQLRFGYDAGLPLWAVGFVLAPLLPFAALALRGHGWPVRRRALALWPVAALAVYLPLSASAGLPALAGMSLPLAILAVQGGQRLALPAPGALALVLLAVLPGMAYSAHTFSDYVRAGDVPYVLDRHDLAAVRHTAGPPAGGSVLASPYMGNVVPAFSGRTTWVAFLGLDPAFRDRREDVALLLEGRLARPQARRLVAVSQARYVLADCGHRTDLTRQLAPARVTRFGCASLYRIDR